jgi:hypothetical protein
MLEARRMEATRQTIETFLLLKNNDGQQQQQQQQQQNELNLTPA